MNRRNPTKLRVAADRDKTANRRTESIGQMI